ncbi:hypothetical protein AAF712_015980, partial [Marasmius tenuissimus]
LGGPGDGLINNTSPSNEDDLEQGFNLSTTGINTNEDRDDDERESFNRVRRDSSGDIGCDLARSPRLSIPEPDHLPFEQSSSPPSDDDVMLRMRIDELAMTCGLSDRQKRRLIMVVMIPSILGEKVSLSLRLMFATLMASNFEESNSKVEEDETLAGYKGVLKEMMTLLEKNFAFSDGQSSNIRSWVRYYAWDPYRLNHREGLEEDVEKFILENAEMLGLAHVKKSPHRLACLKKEIHEKAKQVRNGLRQQVRDSVDAENVTPLETFINHYRPKYVRSGAKPYSDNATTFKMLVMRRFVVDNPDVVWADDDEASDVETTTKNSKRKNHTKAAGGRVAKGQDFWSLFDSFIGEKVKEMGAKISEPGWVK